MGAFNLAIRIFIVSIRAGTEPEKKYRKKYECLYQRDDLDEQLMLNAWEEQSP